MVLSREERERERRPFCCIIRTRRYRDTIKEAKLNLPHNQPQLDLNTV